MGSTGAKRAGGLDNMPPETKSNIVIDDYGRSVTVVDDASEIPAERTLWPSGAFGKDGDYYIVFAKEGSGYSIDITTLTGLKVPLEDQAAVSGIAGWRSWKTSAEADAYIRRYDKPGASRLVQSRVDRAKAFSRTMKKYGF